MSKLLVGSICLTDLMEQAKAKHSAFSMGKNGKIYANVKVWINDEKDKYDNDASIQLNKAKDSQEETPYIGNLKSIERAEPKPMDDEAAEKLAKDEDDLPF